MHTWDAPHRDSGRSRNLGSRSDCSGFARLPGVGAVSPGFGLPVSRFACEMFRRSRSLSRDCSNVKRTSSGEREKMKILVAYDGSDCADAALEDLKKAGLDTTAE